MCYAYTLNEKMCSSADFFCFDEPKGEKKEEKKPWNLFESRNLFTEGESPEGM